MNEEKTENDQARKLLMVDQMKAHFILIIKNVPFDLIADIIA